MAEIKTVGVLGAGLMGSGIAQVAAQAGLRTVVREVSEALCEKGRAAVSKSLDKAIEKGKLTPDEKRRTMARLTFTTDLAAVRDCDIVIEAVVEDLEVKNAMWRELDALCPPRTIFASNTSSLTIAAMAAATLRPDRMVGLHFFNPVPVMKLVEVVRTVTTSPETFDAAMRLGCGLPMGPLALMDLIGIDTTVAIAEVLHREYAEPQFAPAPLLRRMVAAGRLGRKAGRGFYDY